jgi:DNA-binding NtrC family response regulator
MGSISPQVFGSQQGAIKARTVALVSVDVGLRQRLKECLVGLRWTVLEASGGAEAMGLAEMNKPEAMLIDGWLPDLEAGELSSQLGTIYPAMDVLRMDGAVGRGAVGARSPRRHELLHAIREAQDGGVTATSTTVLPSPALVISKVPAVEVRTLPLHELIEAGAPPAEFAHASAEDFAEIPFDLPIAVPIDAPVQIQARVVMVGAAIPEMIGDCPAMRELARLIRLVAPKSATVLIEGETGTGKEVVAKAIHRLSARAGKPFGVLNCAAIPESLLEAELFGHTRGAFTGAVQSRTGRIEAANGGTLFLDEIGEMPLALQAKMLRFLECGELQRVGDNETLRVDVRVIAATHQPLEQRAEERVFRLDLYHRLAVFPLEVPPLRERMKDLPLLVEFFLEQMGREAPRKSVSAEAMVKLHESRWLGNVRELMHVLERAVILAEDRPEIGAAEIQMRMGRRS